MRLFCEDFSKTSVLEENAKCDARPSKNTPKDEQPQKVEQLQKLSQLRELTIMVVSRRVLRLVHVAKKVLSRAVLQSCNKNDLVFTDSAGVAEHTDVVQFYRRTLGYGPLRVYG